MKRRVAVAALASVGLAVLAARDAQAHFRLLYPPQWIQEVNDPFDLGDPQKAGPCGVDSTITYTLTNMVTQFAPGQKITVQWQETVAHDGWFRIALSYKDRADLVDPSYQVNGLNFSVDASVETPPVPPVLVDHLFPHRAADITPPTSYSYELTLPTTPCAKCTLQVIQIMLNHPLNTPGGYTYHHCADIAIVAGADGGSVLTSDAGPTVVPVGSDASPPPESIHIEGDGSDRTVTTGGGGGGDDASANDSNGSASGSSDTAHPGGCDASGGEATGTAACLGLLAGGLIAARRRRRDL